jgi:8-oxo-dGTP pyrophosphatase MutT (NUDIX family)
VKISLLQDAAILVPVYRSRDGELRIVMVLRSAGGVHGGQVAFPGGKRDHTDLSMLETALREAREEVGLTTDRVEVLAHFPAIETHTTGYRVFPFLARIIPPVQWQRAEREIADILDVGLSELVRPEAHGATIERFSTWQESAEVPFYRVGSHRLWGLSYRILHPLIPRLIAGEWDV